MREPHQLVIALSFAVIACNGNGASGSRDTTIAQQIADSPATAARASEPRPVDATAALAAGKEPGTEPATPTPTVTSESSIAAMRQQLQRLDAASAPDLQGSIKEHSRMVGDLFTTMRVEVDAMTSPTKTSWLASADSVEKDLGRLASTQGEELRTAFRAHSTRVRRLLDEFRVLVPRSL